MKKFLCALISATAIFAAVLGGCGFSDGVDGRNGQDLDIYDVYEATNAARVEKGEQPLEFLDFIREYFNYDLTYSDAENMRSVINRTAMSCVSVVSGFSYRSGWGKPGTDYYAGSGVIIDIDKSAGDAYIVTNCHVVYESSASSDYASEIYVYLYGNDNFLDDNDNRMEAEIVGASRTYDLALLKVENEEAIKNGDAAAATFSLSEYTNLGESVFSVGNPSGEGMSVTSGIVSKDSEVISLDITETGSEEMEYRVIRTDAAINGGNSGGGLFNSSGMLIGIINSKVISDEIDNMGYALPASYVRRVCDLMRDGCVAGGIKYGLRRAVFPAKYTYVSQSYYDKNSGLARIIDKVTVTAGDNGLLIGDVITGVKVMRGGKVVDEVEVTRYYNIDDVLLSAREGDETVYTVIRNGESQEINVKLRFSSCG